MRIQEILDNKKLLSELVNKQFEIVGLEISIEELEASGNLVKYMDGKKEKSDWWWNCYYFDDEEQYNAWKEWCLTQLCQCYDGRDIKIAMNFIDLSFGLKVRIKKEVA